MFFCIGLYNSFMIKYEMLDYNPFHPEDKLDMQDKLGTFVYCEFDIRRFYLRKC